MLGLDLSYDLGDTRNSLWWSGLVAKESTELLSLFRGVWRVPRDICGTTFKVVAHEDLIILLGVGVRKNVSSLQCLWKEAEDIIDNQDRFSGRRWSRLVL